MIDVSDLIGIPYKEHGRNKEEGFDCYGLAIEVSKRFGNHLPDFDYDRHDDNYFNSSALKCIKTSKPKRINKLIEGGLILFSNCNNKKNHIGVYLGDGYLIHCNLNGVHLTKIDSLKEKLEIYVWQK